MNSSDRGDRPLHPTASTNWHLRANRYALLITESASVLVNRDGQVSRVRQGDMM